MTDISIVIIGLLLITVIVAATVITIKVTATLSNLNNDNVKGLIDLLEKHDKTLLTVISQERDAADELQSRLMAMVSMQHWSANQWNKINNQNSSVTEEEVNDYYHDANDYYEEAVSDESDHKSTSYEEAQERYKKFQQGESLDPRAVAEDEIGGASIDELID